MSHDDARALRAFTMLAQNGQIVIEDFAKMNGLSADEAEGLLVALSAVAADCEDIATRLDYADAAGTRFAWDPGPAGHGAGPKTRFSADEEAALADVLASYGLCERDPLWTKLFAAKGCVAGVEPDAGAGSGGDAGAGTDGVAGAGAGAGGAAGFGVAGTGGRARPRGDVARAIGVLAPLLDMEEHRVCRIEYRSAGDGKSSARRVAPAAIVADGDASLLRAWDLDKGGGLRSYRIDRIEDVQVEDELFDPAEFPTEVPAKVPRVRLRFSAGTRPPEWDGLRRTGASTPDGGEETSVPWYGTDWLPQHIAAMGGTCAPVGTTPLDDELRERTKAYIDRLREA